MVLSLFGSANSKCAFGITCNFDKPDALVFGGTVSNFVYFVYDMGQKRVGLAAAVYPKLQIKI